MMSVRRAVIDIGTNSIKLLVAEVEGSIVRPVWEESKQTRLGQGFYPERVLQPGPIRDTATAVARFSDKARELEASEIRVIGTSAVREARNPEQLSDAIEKASGVSVRVITGLEEANYVFQGVTSDPRLSHKRLLLLDVGGGSSEFIVGHDQANQFAQSFELGTVRLLGELALRDPPADQLGACRQKLRDFFDNEIGPKVRPALQQSKTSASAPEVEFVGTGGTATILAGMEASLPNFDRERIEQTRLSRQRLEWHVEHLWNMPAAQRKQVVGLPLNRADVILTGAAIYECVMSYFDFDELIVSTRGLRFAVAMESQ